MTVKSGVTTGTGSSLRTRDEFLLARPSRQISGPFVVPFLFSFLNLSIVAGSGRFIRQ
jgi:hypothetical protein